MISLKCYERREQYWLFFSLFIAESLGNTGGCLSQPKEVIWQKTGQSVTLPCEISSHCSANKWKYQWFTFKEKSCFRVKLHENRTKYKLNGASLHINSLHANDSGIYHCAVESHEEPVPGSQHVGPGTTLIVRGKRDNYVKRLSTDVWMKSDRQLFFYLQMEIK